MWIIAFGAIFAVGAVSVWHLCYRVYSLLPERKIGINNSIERRRTLAVFGIGVVVFMAFTLMLGYVNAIIIAFHLLMFLLIGDLIVLIAQKILKKEFKHDLAVAFAVIAAFAYLSSAFIHSVDVRTVRYELKTDKAVGDVRVVMFSDTHIGKIFDGNDLAEYCKKMNGYDPDIVIVAGDFVDEETTREKMIAACKALGTLTPKFGVFYVFGNHDYSEYSFSPRDFTTSDLVRNLSDNGVVVLADEAALIDDRFYIVGRRDASETYRSEISVLTAGLDQTKYTIVADHQPNDYKRESAAKPDLVLSGHTHGGQMFPVGLISDAFGINDRIYGSERRGQTDFIVTSGFSDTAIDFKTDRFSEFVVVDIHGKPRTA